MSSVCVPHAVCLVFHREHESNLLVCSARGNARAAARHGITWLTDYAADTVPRWSVCHQEKVSLPSLNTASFIPSLVQHPLPVLLRSLDKPSCETRSVQAYVVRLNGSVCDLIQFVDQ